MEGVSRRDVGCVGSSGSTVFPWSAGEDYEDRSDLGNVEPGDGMRFKGRGPIQLTGRSNYQSCGQDLGLNLEADPEIVCMPSVGFRSTTWYWDTHGLNRWSDSGSDADFVTQTEYV